MSLSKLMMSAAVLIVTSAAVQAQSQSVHRQHLRWLNPQMGDWTGTITRDGESSVIAGKVSWMLKRNFVMSRWKSEDGRESIGVFAWDPSTEKVKRWTFLNDGTFATSVLATKTDAERVWNADVITRDGSKSSTKFIVDLVLEEDSWTETTKDESGQPLWELKVRQESDPAARVVTQQESAPSHYAHLSFLDSRIGDWKGEFEYSHAGQKSTLKAVSKLTWVMNKNFQLTETRFIRDGSNTGSLLMLTGWDPSIGQVRSWMATSWGTHSESKLVELDGTEQVWETVDVSATGGKKIQRDVAQMSTDGDERSLVRHAPDGSVLFTLTLKRK